MKVINKYCKALLYTWCNRVSLINFNCINCKASMMLCILRISGLRGPQTEYFFPTVGLMLMLKKGSCLPLV